ncbi:glycine oxidase [Granulicella pectinivorans]|uniref:Glycine oxidase n=1 Tax=Granulicella pectinivorans TaxID=474950 RepID=A0A1I6N077_9BACT|nr:FAD-dependent oxidoreductase [Granulicella pectinivorans]SFS21365.1 glycine oxidase [Granulicella pectinivorans]
MLDCDVCVTGAGIIGLSIALELHRRGARVTVLERGTALREASQAAAGMLAAKDPENPVELTALSQLSIARYTEFLVEIERLGGRPVPFQTSLTLQALEGNAFLESTGFPEGFSSGKLRFQQLSEWSLDPRQLAPAIRAAVEATPIRLLEDTAVQTVGESKDGVAVQTNAGEIRADRIVHAMGAWSNAPVKPRKGQMLAVKMPHGVPIDFVVRTPEIYVVPRLHGPRAGQVVIGATVEDAGFSTTTDAASLASLRAMAAEFLPVLADEDACPVLDQWAGLRPFTPDYLPLMGWADGSRRKLIATGHYRNGMLLAPGTAKVVADLLEGKESVVDLSAFSPSRFLEEQSKID